MVRPASPEPDRSDQAVIYRIKAATRDLVAAVGGVDRAALVAGASSSQVSRWQLVTEPDLIPLIKFARLEADCGLALVSGALAGLAGWRIERAGEREDEPVAIMARQAEAVGEMARLMQVAADAFADGRLTPAEAQELDRVAGDAMAKLDRLRQTLSAARAAGVVDLVQRRGA